MNQLVAGLRELTNEIAAAEAPEHVAARIACGAVELVDGADAASLSVRDGGSFRSLGATCELVERLDDLQHRSGEGPCVQVLSVELPEGDQQEIASFSSETRWPAFVEPARATGVGSLLAVAARKIEEPHASLNIYSFRADAFGDAARDAAALLAIFTKVALRRVDLIGRNREFAEQMQEALSSRDVIGKAQGILMQREDLTGAEAFDVLRRLSQRSNRKLRDIARELVDRTERAASRRP